MKAAEARKAARRWVDEVASALPGFQGAFFHGSINGMSDDDPFPATSDVDVGVVFVDSEQLPRLGKIQRDGIIVEGAGITRGRLATPEQLLGDYRLGHSFRTNSVIADPTGHLGLVQQQVERHFAEQRWVQKRCEDAKNNCLKYVSSVDEATLYHARATCWLFAEGNLTHVLLAAAMRNPTVRRRYSAAREVLQLAGRPEVHDLLLRMLGCEAMSKGRVEHHLDRMAEAFDRAVPAVQSDFPFASDISELARPVAVDGSRELIEAGEHREAMFWIAATFARCMAVLHRDGRAEEIEPGFRELIRDLVGEGFEDLKRRTAEIEAFVPDLMALASQLVAANPDVVTNERIK
jgi:hypothetical protein